MTVESIFYEFAIYKNEFSSIIFPSNFKEENRTGSNLKKFCHFLDVPFFEILLTMLD